MGGSRSAFGERRRARGKNGEGGKLDVPGNGGQEQLPLRADLTPPTSALHLQQSPGVSGILPASPTHSFETSPGRPLRPSRVLLLILASSMGISCTKDNSGPEKGSTISRETFVEAYVQLRVQALRSPREELPLEERDEILARMGLEDQDLLTFVEIRGREVQFMRKIWEEVDSILQDMRELGRPPDQRGT